MSGIVSRHPIRVAVIGWLIVVATMLVVREGSMSEALISLPTLLISLLLISTIAAVRAR